MKNIVYIVAINWDLQGPAIKSWEYWCKKNDCDFYVVDEPVVDVDDMAPHWQRYYIYDILENQNIEYDNILYVDADAMVRWDAPNFFDMSDGKLGVVQDLGNFEWVYNGIKGYKQFFPNTDVEWDKYFCTGFLLMNKNHRQFFQDIISFYFKHQDDLRILQYQTLKKGFDQTPVNYLAKLHNIDLQYLSLKCSLGSLHQKFILNNGMFIDMGDVWQFNGIPKEDTKKIMEQVWNQTKENYSE